MLLQFMVDLLLGCVECCGTLSHTTNEHVGPIPVDVHPRADPQQQTINNHNHHNNLTPNQIRDPIIVSPAKTGANNSNAASNDKESTATASR